MGTTPVDNPHGADAPGRCTWSPALALVVTGWIAAVVAGACAAFAGDPPGQLLAGILALGLAGYALYGSRARPRLAADLEGVSVRGLARVARYPWGQITRVAVVRIRRWGRNVAMLEIELAAPDDRLLVFGRLDLGADPDDVSEALHALRP